MENFDEVYGPAAPYSEHRRGERITFNNEGEIWTGEILWVCAAHKAAGRDLPMSYIVDADQQEGFPCVVYPSDIIES